MASAVSIAGLRKTYHGAGKKPDVEAVRGIDLDVPEGSVFAVLGPNGAGKTTTMEILEGYRKRDAGEVSVLGTDPAHASREYRARIGVVLQEVAVPPSLTASEAVARQAGYYRDPRGVAEVLEMTGLSDKANSLVKNLSGGLQRRLDLALGIVGRPELLFLDEPTTGFDPAARREAWHTVKNLTSDGMTILLTTHYMDEAQALADEIAVIADGVIVARGRPDEIGGRDRASVRIRFRLPPGDTLDAVREAVAFPTVLGPGEPHGITLAEGDWATVVTDTPVPVLSNLTAWALAQGYELIGLSVTRPTLEDIYLELVGAAPDGSRLSDDSGGARPDPEPGTEPGMEPGTEPGTGPRPGTGPGAGGET